MRIYHNPRCSKSRQALQILTDANVEPEIVLYLNAPPSIDEIKNLLKKLGFSTARDMMRKGEAAYKELGLKTVTDETVLIQAMAENPKLIERPIVVKGNKAVLGRPPEAVTDLI